MQTTKAHPFRIGMVATTLLASLGAGLLAAARAAAAAGATAERGARAGRPVNQLRIYEIFETNKAAFHARFRDHAARIMRRHGFDIQAMWEAKSPERTEFVYILAWPDAATMEERWAKFMADAEWSDIKTQSAAEHGAMVGRIESRVLQATDYSRPLGS